MIEKKSDLESLVNTVSDLTLIETSEFVDLLKKKLNIEDIPVVAAQAVVAPDSQESKEKEVKSEVSLILKSFADNKKAKVIKALREIRKSEGVEIGVKEAKDMVESAPVNVCENIPVSKAEQYSQLLKEAGAEVESE